MVITSTTTQQGEQTYAEKSEENNSRNQARPSAEKQGTLGTGSWSQKKRKPELHALQEARQERTSEGQAREAVLLEEAKVSRAIAIPL